MRRFLRLLVLLLPLAAAALPSTAGSKESVILNYAVSDGLSGTVQAVLRKPDASGTGQALLILHHAGGFNAGTTTQYADLFTRSGLTTLELKMFEHPRDRPAQLALYAMMASALQFLAQQPGIDPNKVSAMGLSLGAFLTIGATSRWFYDYHPLAGKLRFHRLAAVYPVCWMMSEAVKGQTQGLPAFTGMPADFLQSFAGIPLLILAGGKDNYDASNPNACPDFANAIADRQQAQLTQVKVYPEATHGWDHGYTYSFVAFNACAMRSTCRNFNVSTPATVEKGKQDLLMFFTQP